MALASENIQDRKKRSAGHRSTGSDYATDERADESSDAALSVRPRQPRGTKLVNNPPIKAKRRERSDTASTNRTGTIKRHSVDTAASATPRDSSTPNNGPSSPQREDKIPGQFESETDGTELLTPTAEAPHTSAQQSLRKVASGASLSALSPAASTTAPTTPALTPALTVADESDTEFQSACSTSPRDSYGSFESKKATQHDSDDSGTSTDQDYKEKRHVTEYTDLPMRARISSTATAVPQTGDVTAAASGRGFATRSRQGTN